MPLPPRLHRTRLAAAALFASAVAGLVPACAGAGKRYACNPDAGVCGGNPFSDAGPGSVSDFISTPVIVWHDGKHNSDADLVAYNGALYSAFRHADSYAVSADGGVLVVTSDDQGATWHGTNNLALDGMDLREPKLSVYQSQLHLTATAWDPADPNDHHTEVVAAASSNGVQFAQFANTGLFEGSEAWRPKQAGASIWMTAWKADELYPNDVAGGISLYTSTDGQNFGGPLALPVGPGADQGELLLRADGTLWLTAPERAETDTVDQQTLCHTAFTLPFTFTCWSQAQTPIKGPLLYEFDGLLFVFGEHDLPNGDARTAVWQVDDANQSFDLIADFPGSEGETGDPGVVSLDATHLLVTYHSTSLLDPRVQALSQEPTTLEAISENYAVDVLAVVLDLTQIPAGM